MSPETVLTVLAFTLLVGVAIDYLRLARALSRRLVPAAIPGEYPLVSIVRPVRGLDVGAEENLQALLGQEYPGELEILIVFDDRDDPAYAPTERLIASRRSRRPVKLLVAGTPPPGRTGKLHAMIAGVNAARGEIIGFSDSDTRPQPRLVRSLVEALLARPDAADIFAPALVGQPARTPGDVGYALLLNVWYGCPAALAAVRSGGLPFIMGQIMLWRRGALERIGGIASADGQLVDDMFLGRRAARFGFVNLLAATPLDIFTGGMTVREFFHLFRRWLLFSRNGLPLRFVWQSWVRGIALWLLAAVVVVALVRGAVTPALVATVALVATAASQLSLHRRFGGARVPWRFAWVPLAMPLVAPVVLLSTLVDRKVDWRGRDYALDGVAHLDGEATEHRAASV